MHHHAHRLWQVSGDSSWFPAGLRRPATNEALLRDNLEQLRRHNIVRAFTSGPAVEDWVRADPERVIPSFQLDTVGHVPELLADLRRKFASRELKGLGEVHAQYLGVAASDSLLEPYLALAEEFDVPVAIHMGLGPAGAAMESPYRSRLSSPLHLEEALVRHPKLRVSVMHAGWPFQDDMVAMLYAFPNLYADVGVISWLIPRAEFHAYLKRLVDAGYGNRILFGSDQMQWPEAITRAIDGVESADFLTREQKRDIFCNNAQRFLRLDPQVCSVP